MFSGRRGMMSDFEFVDSHIHFWEPSRRDWYPVLRAFSVDLDHDHLPGDHARDAAAAGARLSGLVHVSAVSKPGTFLDEARWLDGMREEIGVPHAVIGTIDPAAPFERIERDLAAQAESPAFRGIRVLDGLDPSAEATARLFALLGEHGWVFDLVTHPDGMREYAAAIGKAPGTAFVLEHSGWPRRDDPEEFRRWREGLARLAALPNVDCKLSGLPMAFGTMDPARLRPWVEACLELFGTGRCFFGSNFPVDGLAGTYGELLGAYREITAGLSADERDRVFAANARRRYRIG